MGDAIDLRPVQELAAWMREAGVQEATCGDIKLVLGPKPLGPVPVRDPVMEQALNREMEALEHNEEMRVLLHSSGADPSPFFMSAQEPDA